MCQTTLQDKDWYFQHMDFLSNKHFPFHRKILLHCRKSLDPVNKVISNNLKIPCLVQQFHLVRSNYPIPHCIHSDILLHSGMDLQLKHKYYLDKCPFHHRRVHLDKEFLKVKCKCHPRDLSHSQIKYSVTCSLHCLQGSSPGHGFPVWLAHTFSKQKSSPLPTQYQSTSSIWCSIKKQCREQPMWNFFTSNFGDLQKMPSSQGSVLASFTHFHSFVSHQSVVQLLLSKQSSSVWQSPGIPEHCRKLAILFQEIEYRGSKACIVEGIG